MLTKDLLKYKTKKGAIFPEFIPSEDHEALKIAEDMSKIACEGKTLCLSQIEKKWEDAGCDVSRWYPGFKKLLVDRMQWEEVDDSWMKKRWELIREAQSLRMESLLPDLSSFQEAFADSQMTPFTQLAQHLYKDLPEYRCLVDFELFKGCELIHRYNCAQVQGLLIRAQQLKLEIPRKTSIEDKRALFRMLKFHRLIATIDEGEKSRKDEIVIKIDGPLSVVQNRQKYGTKIANFFPWVLHLDKWQISADIEFVQKKKKFTLEISHRTKIVSHYKRFTSYVPEEISCFFENFKKSAEEWDLLPGEDLLNLGKESYCFPDMIFQHKVSKKKVYFELFHKWHKSALIDRLAVLEDNVNHHLVLGVDRNLASGKQFKNMLGESRWFQENGVLFKDFPSVKALSEVLRQKTPM